MLKETQDFLPLGSEKVPIDCQPRDEYTLLFL